MKLRVLLGSLVVLVALAAISLLNTEARWRWQVLGMKATGMLQEIEWRELLPMLKPGSEIWLRPLVEAPNPYAVIVNPRTSPRDIETGRAIFRARCATCHGPAGAGGTAPALTGRDLLHGSSDWALYKTIRNGVGGTPMTGHDYPDADIWKLVAYVQHLSTSSMQAAPSSALSNRLGPSVASDALKKARHAADEWPTFYGSYNGQRHSSLDQINRRNVPQLQARWLYQMPTKGARIQATPLAAGGLLFITDAEGGVIALDAATGVQRWRFARAPVPEVPVCCARANRGVALLGRNVYVATLDARLIALDGSSGRKLWEREIADPNRGYSSTGAPLAVKDMIVTGVAGGEYGANGFVAAFDASDGKPLWRFNTIPGPGEQHNDSWAGESWRTGGATTWMTGTYDPELDLIFWGTANPAPDFNASSRAGDNLYSNCVIALRADTGQLAWYFQASPGDDHDWDSVQTPVLVDVTSGGRTHKLLLQANRNGFFYALERDTGKFIHAAPYVKQTWAERIDENGRPKRRAEATPTTRGTLLYPGSAGATTWWPPTFDPTAQLFIAPALERPAIFFKTATNEAGTGNAKILGGSSAATGTPHYTAVRALEPLTGQRRWEYRSADRNNDAFLSGLMSTAGGLVFTSDQAKFIALDVDNGRELWSFQAGGNIFAPASTFLVGAEQFVAFVAGDVVVALALPRDVPPAATRTH